MTESGGQDEFQAGDETLVDRGFRIQDPVDALAQFCQKEIPRLRDTLPEYNEPLFQEALEMTLARLRQTNSPPPPAGDEA